MGVSLNIILMIASTLLLLDAINYWYFLSEVPQRWRAWRVQCKIEEVWWGAHNDNEDFDECHDKVHQMHCCATCGAGVCLYNPNDLRCRYGMAHNLLTQLHKGEHPFWWYKHTIDQIFEQFMQVQRMYTKVKLARDIIAETEADAKGELENDQMTVHETTFDITQAVPHCRARRRATERKHHAVGANHEP